MTAYGIEWEREAATLWAAFDDLGEQEFLLRMTRLVDRLPDDHPVGIFELAGALDSTGFTEQAVPLYMIALDSGLRGLRRRRATIQLASSLRALGRAEESVQLLTEERALMSETGDDELSDELCTVLALALVDVGREREAVSVAVTALAPHLTRYQRSMANYARQLLDD